jgi:hypothetical protein
MRPSDFTKENVRKVVDLVEARFRAPRILYINIFTELQDLETPEEREGPAASESPTSKRRHIGSNAIIVSAHHGRRTNAFMYFSDGSTEYVYDD